MHSFERRPSSRFLDTGWRFDVPTGNQPFRPRGPARFGAGERDHVDVEVALLHPLADRRQAVDATRAGGVDGTGHPADAGRNGDGGQEAALRGTEALPGSATVIGIERIRKESVGLLIVAADGHAVELALKHQRKNAGGTVVRLHRRIEDEPGLAEVGGAEYASNRTTAGGEPSVPGALHRQAGIARGECAFIGKRCGKSFRGDALPGFSSVGGRVDHKVAIHGVTDENSVLGVPKSYAIEECAFGFFFQNETPRLARVCCPVNPGLALFRWARTHEYGGGVIEGANAAKIKAFGFWNLEDIPALAGIDGPEDCGFGTADPDDVVVDGTEAAKAGFGGHRKGLPLGDG